MTTLYPILQDAIPPKSASSKPTFPKSMRQRLAWQWWYRRQVSRLHHSAESIRNGLLQHTFALRRQLESTEKNQPANNPTQDQWLDDVQTIYHSLERLSNDLLPPFLIDNLPLAFNFAVQARQYAAPSLKLSLELPTDWPNDSTEPDVAYKNQMLLSVFIELLTLLIDRRESAQQLRIVLKCYASQRSLSIEIVDSDSTALRCIAQKQEVQYIQEIFQTLSGGQLELAQEGTVLTAQMNWHSL